MESRYCSLATRSRLINKLNVISLITLCTLFWISIPEAFAVPGKYQNLKTAPKTAGRTSQAPTLNTLLNGLGAPSAIKGIDGDFYLDTLSSNLYGPKKKGKWPLPKNLVGPAGPQGPVGKQGSEGKVGDKGATTSSAGTQGIQGIPGVAGGTGPSGGVGVPGSVGATGAPGPQGSQGSAGAPGIGATGLQGVAGAPGSTGARGPIGETGTAGADGLQGAAGASRAVLGNINFTGTLSGGVGVGKESSAFGDLQVGKKYLVISNIFTTSTSTIDPSIGVSISVSGAAITPISKFVTISGNGYRSSIENFEYGVQVFTTVDASSITGPNFNLKVAISSGANTSGSGFGLVITGFYMLQEVNALT